MSTPALNDAKLIVAYLSTHGWLPAASPLPAAIATAEAQLAAGPLTTAQEQALYDAINAAAPSLGAKTIEQLRAEHEARMAAPSPVHRFFSTFLTIAIATIVGGLCLVLIFAVIPLTTNFNRLGVFVGELKPTDVSEYFGTLTEARLLQGQLNSAREQLAAASQPVPAARNRPQPGPKVDQAQIDKLEAELKPKAKYLQEAASRISVNAASINRLIDSNTGAPQWYALIVESAGFDYAADFLWHRVLNVPQSAVAAPPASAGPGANAKDPCNKSIIEKKEGLEKASKPAPPTKQGTQSKPEKPVPAAKPEKPEVYWETFCTNREYAAGIGLPVTTPSEIFAASKARAYAESLNVLLGSAILPVLYGLLGASVYLLRQAWGDDMERGKGRTLGIGSFIRLALGGIAGLAIGWFWVPSAKASGDLAILTTTPFVLAFLAGFSIELLFTLINRVLAAINPPPQK